MSKPHRQQGFSLLESLVTLSVLGIGLAGSAQLQGLTFNRMLHTKARTEALILSIEQLEQIRFDARYTLTPNKLPRSNTYTGIHSRYFLHTSALPGKPDLPLRINQVATWDTPTSKNSLKIDSYLTKTPYNRYLYRLYQP